MYVNHEEKTNLQLADKPKTYVVMNPVAGMTAANVVRQRIESTLAAHGITFEVFETRKGDDIHELVREAVAKGFELFIAVGGDGTLSAVASGLVGSEALFAIIPTGTWNAFARNLDIPLQVEDALNLLFQEHRVRAIDAMQLDGHFRFLNISAGIGSRAMGLTKRSEKRRFGKFADLWYGFLQLIGFQTYRFDITVDGKRTLFRASELMVANAPNIGVKAFKLDPDIRLDDGRLNVCRIYANNLLDYLKLAISIALGEQEKSWNVLCLEAEKEVEIHCEKKLPIQADGEIVGHLPARIKLHKQAVKIITPVNLSP